MSNNVMGYIAKDSFVHRLHSTSKLVYFLVVSTATMLTYDTWLLAIIALSSLYILRVSKIRYVEISFIVKFILFFSVLNIILVYLFDPMHGTELYGSTSYIFTGWKWFQFTYEEFFYIFNLILKYLCTIPLAIAFIMTTNPSQFASSLNQIGVSYKISYAVSLTLRYIPDVQNQYLAISKAQQARGLDLSKKTPFFKRVKAITSQILPLILQSFNNIETINQAMELRRFGSMKKRTWITKQPMRTVDWLVIVIAFLSFITAIVLWQINGSRFYNPFH